MREIYPILACMQYSILYVYVWSTPVSPNICFARRPPLSLIYPCGPPSFVGAANYEKDLLNVQIFYVYICM